MLLAALCWPAAASAGVEPGQGQLINVNTKISGKCTPVTPPEPGEGEEWGPEHDGTPWHATYAWSAFVKLPETQPFDPNEGDYFYDYVDKRCEFDDGSTEVRLSPGVWKMYVVTERIDKTYDSVTKWIPAAPDDGERRVTEEVAFQITTKNPCDSPWQGVAVSAPYCLKQKEKRLAAHQLKIAREAAKSYVTDVNQPAWQRELNTLYVAAKYGGRPEQYVEDELSKWGSLATFSWAARRALKDPPDHHYKSIAKPRPRGPKLPGSTPLAKMVSDVDHAVGCEGALVTAINRANGAFVAAAGDSSAEVWMLNQNSAADNDMRAAATRFQGAAHQAARVRRQLAAAGMHGPMARWLQQLARLFSTTAHGLKRMESALISRELQIPSVYR
jgi:hypothetical protein